MAKIQNVSPLGDLVIPTLRLTVKAGEIVDVADDAAASLLEQPSNWASADAVAPTATPDAPAAQN